MTGRLKPYPGYKDSGVEWLGRIPAQWRVKRLRFATTVNPSKTELRGLSGDTMLSFLPMERIGEDGSLDLGETRRLDQVAQGFTYFRDGDVLVAKITPCFENGKGGICRGLLGGVGFGTTELHVLRPLAEIDSAFLFYITKSTAFRWFGMITMYGAAGQQRVSEEFIRDFGLPLPELVEQAAIASFLDRETGKIDALVNKKERLIELLQEKRTALISHAVTQGLNPNAPKKDSGIPWLGHIPKHWDCLPLRRFVVSMCDGPFGSDMKSSHYADSGIRLIRLQNIGQGQFDDTDQAFIPEAHFKSLPGHDALPGDLLVAGLGDPNNPVGRACLLPSRVPIAMVKADCFRVRLKQDQLVHSFVSHFLCSSAARGAAQDQTRGATRERINLTGLSRINVTAPPPVEQERIVDYIGTETARLDALMAKVLAAIERLQEYRTALISAAVTGQIDVRSGR